MLAGGSPRAAKRLRRPRRAQAWSPRLPRCAGACRRSLTWSLSGRNNGLSGRNRGRASGQLPGSRRGGTGRHRRRQVPLFRASRCGNGVFTLQLPACSARSQLMFVIITVLHNAITAAGSAVSEEGEIPAGNSSAPTEEVARVISTFFWGAVVLLNQSKG